MAGRNRRLVRTGAAIVSAVAVAAPLIGEVLAAQPASAQVAGAFVATGSLATARSHATATRLTTGPTAGDVLVTGGQDATGNPLGSAELYNPATGFWAPTAPMPVAVTDATATLLGNGEVLVAGGLTGTAGALVPTAASQLFDPATDQWSMTGALQLATFDASAVWSTSGEVLYAGGLTSTLPAATAVPAAEIYNVNNHSWNFTPSALPTGVAGAQIAALTNGDVLVAGGETGPSGTTSNAAEIYQTSPNTWSPVGAMVAGVAYGATATLSNGEVLVAGGETTPTGAITPTTQIFNPSTSSWQSEGGLPESSYGATATLLGTGEVLYAGGLTSSSGAPSAAAELYDPSNGTWTTTGSLLAAEGFGTTTALDNGDVLIAGGQTVTGVTAEAELYEPTGTATTGAPTISSPSTFDVVAGSFNAFTVTTTGTPAPIVTESGALPPGLTFAYNGNGTATISGTPPVGTSGSYPVTLTASNGVGSPAVQQLFLVVASAFPGAPTITSPSSLSVTANQYGTFTITTTGSPTPTVTETGALPTGMSFTYDGNGTATISGTPASSSVGSYVITVTASNGAGSPATQQLVITVNSAPVVVRQPKFTSPSRILVLPGENAVITITATGSPAPTITESGTLPAGMAFHDNRNGTATISGAPPAGLSAAYSVTLIASNGASSSANQVLRLTVGRPPTPELSYGAGYWYATSAGEVIGQGYASAVAPQGEQHPSGVVSLATTPDHLGYYLASSSGGVFPYGDARWYGSVASRHLSTPTVAIAVTPSGGGYYLVTRAGNVITFGDARWYGSTAGRHTPPIAAFAVTPDGGGYWLVSVYGNIYGFGDARFYGSPANRPIPRVVAFAPARDGRGYFVVTDKGNVFNYGDARWYGSPAQRQVPPVVAFSQAPSGQGYWVVTDKGNIFNYGDARWYGSAAGTALAGAVTAFAVEP
ncbi:MAG: kelch repeat-containing protein [Acidimicrobiales bacterium]